MDSHTGPDLGSIILVGGQSRRMGRNKALLRLTPDGPTLIEQVIAAVAPFGPVLLVTAHSEVDLVQLNVPPLLVGRTAQALVVPGEVNLIAFERAGKVLLPTPGMMFQEGDVVYLAVLAASADRLKAMLALT